MFIASQLYLCITRKLKFLLEILSPLCLSLPFLSVSHLLKKNFKNYNKLSINKFLSISFCVSPNQIMSVICHLNWKKCNTSRAVVCRKLIFPFPCFKKYFLSNRRSPNSHNFSMTFQLFRTKKLLFDVKSALIH